MRRHAAWARLLFPPTLALAVVVAFVPGRVSLAVRIYALVVSACVLGLTVAVLRRAFPVTAPLRRRAPEPRPKRQPPPSLAQLENEAVLGVASAYYLHYRLAPRLRALAAGILEARRGVSLDDDPEEALRLLGDETWALLRGDRLPPEDRQARGIPPDALQAAIDTLESV